MTPGAVLGGLIGLLWGLCADRLAARWPEHEAQDDDGQPGTGLPPPRSIDWRTAAVAGAGAIAGMLVVMRFGDASGATLGVMTLYVGALVVLFATDLDQRLLPDVITLPLIAVAAAAGLLAAGPYVSHPDELAVAAVGAVVAPLGLYLVSIPFGKGAIGQGDLKLLVSVGLLGGPVRLFSGLIAGAVLAAAVILVLIAARRITLKSYVPYGPFLILGAMWALLVLANP